MFCPLPHDSAGPGAGRLVLIYIVKAGRVKGQGRPGRERTHECGEDGDRAGTGSIKLDNTPFLAQ